MTQDKTLKEDKDDFVMMMITRPSVMEVSPQTFQLSKSILLIDHRIPGDHRIAGDHRITGDHRIAGIIE